jgi:Zn-dependent protease
MKLLKLLNFFLNTSNLLPIRKLDKINKTNGSIMRSINVKKSLVTTKFLGAIHLITLCVLFDVKLNSIPTTF